MVKDKRKKEGIKKTLCKKSCLIEVGITPTPTSTKNSVDCFNFFFWEAKLCSVRFWYHSHLLFSQEHKRSDSFLVGENLAMPDVLSTVQHLYTFKVEMFLPPRCWQLDNTAFYRREETAEPVCFVCTERLCWSHLPCLWIKDSPCNIWNVMFLTTDSGSNLFLQKRRPAHDDSSWPK